MPRRRICLASDSLRRLQPNRRGPPMYRAMFTAASGMEAQQLNLDNVANNLANASTAGFRRRRLQFQDLIYQSLVAPGAAATQQTTFPTGLQIGLGSRTAASEIIQQQGDYNQTGNPGGAEGLGTIQQGVLENSNVDVVGEFIQMIIAQRSYEANSRVVRAADEMFQTINGLSS